MKYLLALCLVSLGVWASDSENRPSSIRISSETSRHNYWGNSIGTKIGLNPIWQLRGGYFFSSQTNEDATRSFYLGASFRGKEFPISGQLKLEAGTPSKDVRTLSLANSIEWKVNRDFQVSGSIVPTTYRDSSTQDKARHVEFGLGLNFSPTSFWDLSLDASAGTLKDERSLASSLGVIQNKFGLDSTFYLNEDFSVFYGVARSKYFEDEKIKYSQSAGIAWDVTENLGFDFTYNSEPSYKFGASWTF